MSLTNILTAIQEDLVAQLASASLTQFAGLTFKLGGRELTANDAPPRIAWVRTTGTYGPAEQGVRAATTTARILRTHLANVEAHVWAEPNVGNHNDDSDTELLAHALVASVYRVTRGSFEVLTDEWLQPGWMKAGYLCIVRFRFKEPVLDVLPVNSTPPNEASFDNSEPPPSGVLQAPGDE